MGIWEKMPESFLAALDTEFGITAPARHGSTRSTRSAPCATARVGVRRDGRQLRLRHPRHRRHRGGAAHLCADGAGVDETEPLPPRDRAHRADSAVARAHRQGRQPVAKQVVTVEDSMSMVHLSRGGLDPAGTTCAARSRSCAESRRRCSGPTIRCRGPSSRSTTTASGTRSHASCPASRTSTPASADPTGSCCPTPRATNAASPPDTGKANFAVNDLVLAPGAAGQAHAADDAQPRPVQHHHLRSRRPLPRRQGRPAGDLRHPDDITALGFRDGDRVDLVSEWLLPGEDGRRNGGPTTSGSCPTPLRGATPQPTIPKRIR